MNSRLVSTLEMSQPPKVVTPDLMLHVGFVFHYHIYDNPVPIVSDIVDSPHDCFWREVVPEVEPETPEDIMELWSNVADTFIAPERKEHLLLVNYVPVKATQCSNCGKAYTLISLKPCACCKAGLCKACYKLQSYCNVHHN